MDIIANYRFHHIMPWRVPMTLILGLLIVMTTFAGTGTRAADNDTSVTQTLTILSRACEIDGGQFNYTIDLNEDGSINAINGSCSAKGGPICTIWSDGDFVCVRTKSEQTIQQQVAQPGSTGTIAASADHPLENSLEQSTGIAGPKVESRMDGQGTTMGHAETEEDGR